MPNEREGPANLSGFIVSIVLLTAGTILLVVGGALLWSIPAALVILGVIALIIGFYLAFII